KLLFPLNIHSTAFTRLYRAYEYIIILLVTQVDCECAFSKLKIINNYLRSSV
ncbi:zinc finger MYM-type protein 1-like, partial [Aphis craccivora]